MKNAGRGRKVVSQIWTSAWKKNYSHHICEIYLDNLAVCLHIKFCILLVFNRECMERNVMISFRILSSLECFLRYFQTEWLVFFTLQCELFTTCNISNNASLVSARTGGGSERGRGGGQPNLDRHGQGRWGSQKFPNLFRNPLWMNPYWSYVFVDFSF